MTRVAGALMMLAAVVMLGYFLLAFDISVPVPDKIDKSSPYFSSSGRTVNEGLMNDRIVGTLVAAALGLCGGMLFVSVKIHPKTGWRIGPAPQPPRGFNYDLPFAMHYQTRPHGSPSLPRQQWNRAVSHYVNLSLYQPEQIEWAYEMGVDPKNFETFVGYIEEYRSWQFSGGMTRA